MSKQHHEGYLLIDQREAPPVPINPLLVGKPEALPVASGSMYESATITCCHCQVVVVLNPLRTRERGYCSKCDHYVCDHPTCNSQCVPFKKIVDDALEAAVKGFTPLPFTK